jgi:hypothetical protein
MFAKLVASVLPDYTILVGRGGVCAELDDAFLLVGLALLYFDTRRDLPAQASSAAFAKARYALRRAMLQRHRTQGAKHRLKKLRNKESRFRKQTNHCMSKEIVATRTLPQRDCMS